MASTKVKIDDPLSDIICNPQHVQKMYSYALHKYNEDDFFRDEIARRLLSKVEDIKQDFAKTLTLGDMFGSIQNNLPPKLKNTFIVNALSINNNLLFNEVNLKYEENFPFKNGVFDLCVNHLSLPYINDIPSLLVRMGRATKKGGLILLSTLGSESFRELKEIYNEIEGENRTPHFMPFSDVKEMGKLMQSCGFELPVADRDLITIEYPDFFALMKDLKNYAGKNMHINRKKGLTSPRKMKKVNDLYKEKFANADGSIPVTMEVIYLHGWRPNT